MFEILLRGGSQKRHFPFRRSAILAERFYITENEVSCYIKKRALPKQSSHLNAADRNRTGTKFNPRRILSPVRLPVPPLRHPIWYPVLGISILVLKWMEVDSNHRSVSQQIYSLPPLATRESIQADL